MTTFSIAKFFDADWQVLSDAGNFVGFVDGRGRPIFLPIWTDAAASGLFRPDGSIATNFDISQAANQPWDIAGFYNPSTIGSKLQDLSLYAVTIGSVANQTTLVADVNGNLTVGAAQNIGAGSSPAFAGLTLTGPATLQDVVARKINGTAIPTLSSWGTGAGASSVPTAGGIVAGSTDVCCLITVTPSAAPAVNALIANIAWSGGNGMFGISPICLCISGNRQTAGIQGAAASAVIATGGPNGFTITSGSATGLTAGNVYIFAVLTYGA